MNKKTIVTIIIILFLIVGIVAIVLMQNNNKEENNTKIETQAENNQNEVPTNNNEEKKENKTEAKEKSLVLYFSATGTTKKVAETISKATNSDIIEIEPKEAYTSEDLSYNNKDCRANKEQENATARPEIKNEININDYNVIYLGYPIWWGTNPKIILTVLDKYNFDEKIVIPFCTSGSTGIEASLKELEEYNSNIRWLKGRRFNSSVSTEEINEWVNELGINTLSEEEYSKMYIKIDEKILTATLENNSSADRLIEKLKQGDLKIDMKDYSNFEKVGQLGFDLPRNDEEITTTFGDIILYQGNQITIYYDTNNWNLTKLGHIDNITQEELKEILGSEDVTVILSLNK